MIGPFIDGGSLLVGSSLGLILNKKLPKRINIIIFQVIGIFTLFYGISSALKSNNYIILILSIVIGSLIGELINIDKYVVNLSNYLKIKINIKNKKFNQGLITTFFLIGMGPTTILAAMQESLSGNLELIYTIAVLNFFAGMALAAAMGVGVALATIPLLIYQSSITLFAAYLEPFLLEQVIYEFTAVGGLILIALSLSVLEIKQIKVMNMLPGLIIATILAYLIL